jgi:hypothetical protein
MKHITPALAFALCFFTLFASPLAAQKPSPSATVPISPPFDPARISAMSSSMMNAMFTEATKPERAAALAKFQRQYYEALIKEGFTKDEALSIVKANQLSSFTGSR